WFAWSLMGRSAQSEKLAERQSFEQRAAALAASARAPGVALGCLGGMAGEQVEAACERAVFATPDSVASAVNYVAAQIALLSEALDAERRNNADYDTLITPMLRGLEADRYGIVAHVLLQRDSCAADQCDDLGLLRDPNRVRANLQDKPFNALVAKYAPSWATMRLGPVADFSHALPATVPGGPTGVPVSSKYEFPSSSSIPPVNIMSSESAAAAAAAAPAAGNASAPPAAAPPAPSAASLAGEPAPVPARRPAPRRTSRPAAAAPPPPQQTQPTPLVPPSPQ
ncbi:MAG: hypothetical protein JO289_08980, partial [Xanthobacteraceae bacterium]|nr:hypothetical protein [Xanthobacteraceae bacterium]